MGQGGDTRNLFAEDKNPILIYEAVKNMFLICELIVNYQV